MRPKPKPKPTKQVPARATIPAPPTEQADPPKQRRGHGSIHERAPKVWTVRVTYGRDRETGTQIREAHTVHGTRRDAERKLRELLTLKDQHRGPIREARKIGFAEFAVGTTTAP